jgi:hypothetical protein
MKGVLRSGRASRVLALNDSQIRRLHWLHRFESPVGRAPSGKYGERGIRPVVLRSRCSRRFESPVGRAPSGKYGERGIRPVVLRSRCSRRFESPVGRAPSGKYGERGIRTPDTLSRIPDFESGAFNHSAISPQFLIAQRAIRNCVLHRPCITVQLDQHDTK